MNPGASERKARRKRAIPYQRGFFALMDERRAQARQLAEAAAEPAVREALEYCRPWRKVVRAMKETFLKFSPIQWGRNEYDGSLILRFGSAIYQVTRLP